MSEFACIRRSLFQSEDLWVVKGIHFNRGSTPHMSHWQQAEEAVAP